MSVRVDLYVEDIADRLEDFAVLRLFRDAVPTGAFGTQVATIPLVAGQTSYLFTDDAGDALTWYRYDFQNPDTLEQSDPSAPFRAGGTTLASARFSAAGRADASFRSACTAAGTTTSLTDAGLRDQGVDRDFLSGAWVRRPQASHDDRVRRLGESPFNPATGALTVQRAWSVAPTDGEAYEVYTVLPPVPQPGAPYAWDRAVREGLLNIWFIDQVLVATADGANREFDLGPFPHVRKATTRRVLTRRVDSEGRSLEADAGKNGRGWAIREDGPKRTLVLSRIPASGLQVIVEVNRRADPVYLDDDFIPVDEELVGAAAVVAAYRHLSRVTPTKAQYAAELAGALSEFEALYERPTDVVIEG